MSLPKTKILVVVTVGGSTNSAPILEICGVLAARGHTIEFATLSGREGLIKPYPFVTAIHIVRPAITPEQDEEHYRIFSRWNWNTAAGKRDIVKGKMAFDAFWPATYRGLKQVLKTSRPDFIFSDFHVEAALDISLEYRLPHAVMWPQMPWLMMPQKYIPGQPGMQQRCLTSEHASIYDRLFEMTFLFRSAPYFLHWVFWAWAMRRKEGVFPRPKITKPDYLPVGPILADPYPALEGPVEEFVKTHKKIAFVAFGTHAILDETKVAKIINGLGDAIWSGAIDGVVWVLGARTRRQLNANMPVPAPRLSHLNFGQLLENKHPQWHFASWAPQRVLLAHPSVVIFVTHSGPSSVNDSIFHGVPMITMGIFRDQMITSMRIERSGIAVRLNKDEFDAKMMTTAINDILAFKRDYYENVQRMQRIAIIGSRRKHLAADMIEEHLYDWDGRFEISLLWHGQGSAELTDKASPQDLYNRGKELQPMHLQTPDVRMSWWRLNNMDIGALLIGVVGFSAFSVYSLVQYAGSSFR